MSRHGYSMDGDFTNWDAIRWRGALKSAVRGARGQAALRELLAALDALPEKRLAAGVLATAEGEFCALGALGAARGMALERLDPEDLWAVAQAFGIPRTLAAEVMFQNDESADELVPFNFEVCGPMRPWERHRKLRWRGNPRAAEIRFNKVREWVARQIVKGDPK